uniref:Uncharacterized protein n=1 Tax=Endocarpon pusillum TaxID=364733 RepID=F8QX05_9EURO|nr:hypothetical protein [Endocarpon pusillum]
MDTANLQNSPLIRPQTPPSLPPSPPPSTANETTRDQRIQVHTLRNIGFTYKQIHQQLGLTYDQVQYAVNHQVTLQKRKGRPSKLTLEDIN